MAVYSSLRHLIYNNQKATLPFHSFRVCGGLLLVKVNVSLIHVLEFYFFTSLSVDKSGAICYYIYIVRY